MFLIDRADINMIDWLRPVDTPCPRYCHGAIEKTHWGVIFMILSPFNPSTTLKYFCINYGEVLVSSFCFILIPISVYVMGLTMLTVYIYSPFTFSMRSFSAGTDFGRQNHSPHIDVAQVNPSLFVTTRHVWTKTAHFEQFCWYNNCRLINTLKCPENIWQI